VFSFQGGYCNQKNSQCELKFIINISKILLVEWPPLRLEAGLLREGRAMIQTIKMWKLALLVIVLLAFVSLNGCGAKGDLVQPDSSAKPAAEAPAAEAPAAEAPAAAEDSGEKKAKDDE